MRPALPKTMQTNGFSGKNGMAIEPSVAEEIRAYLAARDFLVREAEAAPTEINLQRALAANEFAENWLRAARSPYEAQFLSEKEASRERARCQAIKLRLAELRRRVATRRRAA